MLRSLLGFLAIAVNLNGTGKSYLFSLDVQKFMGDKFLRKKCDPTQLP
ncbi:hypothetical protein H6G04_35055 [Calothrix membranacea FACHB-236]|nr:hypothetical protein [Calothrix membranacea FACHB-236]